MAAGGDPMSVVGKSPPSVSLDDDDHGARGRPMLLTDYDRTRERLPASHHPRR
jgi:hypothetical protein